jgi:hypothetical protein
MLNSLIGIIASSGAGGVANSYESIATTTVGSGGSATITFSSIPSTYQHLQIRGLTLSSSANNNIIVRLNSDTGTNYSYHVLNGTGTIAESYGGTSSTIMSAGYTGASSNASVFVTDILDYGNTNKYTTIKSLGGIDQNGSGYVNLHSGAWRNTAAVTTITITHGAAVNFAEYSSFALYGIKG